MQNDHEDDIPSLPCHDKLAFGSQKEAQAAATLAAHRYGRVLKVYKCRYCELWHLSSH